MMENVVYMNVLLCPYNIKVIHLFIYFFKVSQQRSVKEGKQKFSLAPTTSSPAPSFGWKDRKYLCFPSYVFSWENGKVG
jgi:hypothetical protein